MKISFKKWCYENDALDFLTFYELGRNPIESDKIGSSSSKKVTLTCPKCNLSWQKSLNKLTRKPIVHGCPFCNHRLVSPFYNLKIKYPELIKEWDYELNDKKPEEYLPSSYEEVFWNCGNGHKWKTKIRNRTDSIKRHKTFGCPYCKKRIISNVHNLLTDFPYYAKQWNYVKNGNLSPSDFPPKSQKSVWWTCDFNPNHTWKDRISNRTSLNRGCKICSKERKISFATIAIYYYLYKVTDDVEIEKSIGKYRIDIVLNKRKIAIEHNGYYYHRNRENNDLEKVKMLENMGYKVIVIKDSANCKRVTIKENTITYPFSCQNKYLDELILKIFELLNITPIDVDINKDIERINDVFYHERKKRTLSYVDFALAQEYSSNNKDKADTIMPNSTKKVLWICPKCNQEYSASVNSRHHLGSGCPYCSGLLITKEKSLESIRPDLAVLFHPTLNYPLTARNISPKNDKKIAWICDKGHIWYARTISLVKIKTNKYCPFCYPRKRKCSQIR